MSIKVKIGNLIGSQESGALSRFACASMPFKTARRMRETLEDIQDVLRTYEKDRLELLTKHSPKNEDGTWKLKEDGSADLTPEQLRAFHDELGEILHAEVTLRGSHITQSNLFSSTGISPNDLAVLEWLIPDESKPESEKVSDEILEAKEIA